MLCKDRIRLRTHQFIGLASIGPNMIWNEQNVKFLRPCESCIYIFSNQNSVHPSSIRSKTNITQLSVKPNMLEVTYIMHYDEYKDLGRIIEKKEIEKVILAYLVHLYIKLSITQNKVW